MKKMNGFPLTVIEEGEPGFDGIGDFTALRHACDRFLTERGALTPGELENRAKAQRASARRWSKKKE